MSFHLYYPLQHNNINPIVKSKIINMNLKGKLKETCSKRQMRVKIRHYIISNCLNTSSLPQQRLYALLRSSPLTFLSNWYVLRCRLDTIQFHADSHSRRMFTNEIFLEVATRTWSHFPVVRVHCDLPELTLPFHVGIKSFPWQTLCISLVLLNLGWSESFGIVGRLNKVHCISLRCFSFNVNVGSGPIIWNF